PRHTLSGAAIGALRRRALAGTVGRTERHSKLTPRVLGEFRFAAPLRASPERSNESPTRIRLGIPGPLSYGSMGVGERGPAPTDPRPPSTDHPGRRVLLLLGPASGGMRRHVEALVEGMTPRGFEPAVAAPASVHLPPSVRRFDLEVPESAAGLLDPRAMVA